MTCEALSLARGRSAIVLFSDRPRKARASLRSLRATGRQRARPSRRPVRACGGRLVLRGFRRRLPRPRGCPGRGLRGIRGPRHRKSGGRPNPWSGVRLLRLRQGAVSEAESNLRARLQLCQARDDKLGLACCIESLGAVAALSGQVERWPSSRAKPDGLGIRRLTLRRAAGRRGDLGLTCACAGHRARRS
jgi:hypothetical protein